MSIFTARTVSATSFDDVQVVLGSRTPASECQCQLFRLGPRDPTPLRRRRELLSAQLADGHGVLAYVEDDPVGWCSVQPRRDARHLGRAAWRHRTEDPDDPTVWAITCFVVHPAFPRRGVSRVLLDAAIGVARAAGAHVLEAYPIEPRTDAADDRELHVGVLNSFVAAGFRIAHTTSLHRSVVRYDL